MPTGGIILHNIERSRFLSPITIIIWFHFKCYANHTIDQKHSFCFFFYFFVKWAGGKEAWQA